MQRLDLIVRTGDKQPGDSFKVFANVSPAGRPLEAINTSKAITGEAAVPFFTLGAGAKPWGRGPWGSGPLAGPSGSVPGAWGRGPWGREPWGTSDPDAGHHVTTPSMYHGNFQFQVTAYDRAGNEHEGTAQVFRRTVNSGPQPVLNLRHSSTVAGRPVFTFRPPVQFTED